MASNAFGTVFKITTWGESHGKAIGVVIDGCPAGLAIHAEEVYKALTMRSPGKNSHTSPRNEPDMPEILSGVFEGLTTGAPISILIRNQDVDSSQYESIRDLIRPGHANYTFLEKYGIFDYRGGGRASARETACRVAAGAIASKFLESLGIKVMAYIKQIGSIKAHIKNEELDLIYKNPVFCPDSTAASMMIELINLAKAQGDSLGGIVEFRADGLPAGLGDPVYEKLEAKLANAMMSIPASKGFEMGSGFQSVEMPGSQHNDLFTQENGKVTTQTNHAGGVLGGISNGMPVVGRVVFKPTSSIMIPQQTITTEKNSGVLQMPEGSRHDPCVAIRAVAVVKAMLALVLVDTILLNRCARL